MHPSDLADERARRSGRAFRRLAVDFRQAFLHATDDEAAQLKQLARLCRLGHIAPDDARQDVNRLRQTQEQRRTHRQAA